MKLKFILLIVLFGFIGFSLNTPDVRDQSYITQKQLNEYEENIVIKGNDYQNKDNTIESNAFNKAGKGVENAIDKTFDFLFHIVKGFIDDK